jgi:hypothetical protein
MKNIIKILVLTLTLAGAAFAQFETIEPVDVEAISFSGNQTNEGRFVDPLNQVMGNSFVLNGYNRSYTSLLLTVSFDSDGPADYQNGNVIVGGSWNLAVYSNGTYLGSIYGEVTKGTLKYMQTASGQSKNTSATLRVDGGTGDFERIEMRTEGRIDADTNLETGETISYMRDFVF